MVVLAPPAALAAGGAPWRRPVAGPLLRAFAVGADRYARGQHRGVDLGAPIGTLVRSACTGRVSFAGRVPGGGRTVSVRCGAFAATYQQLGTIAVRAGRSVVAGTSLGTIGRSGDPRTPSPHLHLGARTAATRRYVDPLGLLGRGPRPDPLLDPARPGRPRAVPLGPAPRGALPRPVTVGTVPRPVAVGAARDRSLSRPVAGAPAPIAAPSAPLGQRPVPLPVAWYAWLGLVSVGLALPVGGLLSARTRRRRVALRGAPVRR